MPRFRDGAVSAAPPEEVWKLLYDPRRFPEWWAGIAAVDAEAPQADGTARFGYYPDGGAERPLPQLLQTSSDARRAVVSCLVHGFRFEWTLEPVEGGGGTRIDVVVDVPDAEAPAAAALREGVGRSVRRLAGLAAEA
jgi:uncharacterized protein YndB with AHSA1/START domain